MGHDLIDKLLQFLFPLPHVGSSLHVQSRPYALARKLWNKTSAVFIDEYLVEVLEITVAAIYHRFPRCLFFAPLLLVLLLAANFWFNLRTGIKDGLVHALGLDFIELIACDITFLNSDGACNLNNPVLDKRLVVELAGGAWVGFLASQVQQIL